MTRILFALVATAALAASPATAETGTPPADGAPTGALKTGTPPAGGAPPASADDASTYRAALLVEAPELPTRVRTDLGRVSWRLRKLGDAGHLAAEADVDIPGDKMKVVVTFAKGTDAAVAETIAVRFMLHPGSGTADVSRIATPQLRVESDQNGRPLAGLALKVVPNDFLVGLDTGQSEITNLALLKGLPWIDIPMLLADRKIAKVTFEKGEAGQHIVDEAVASWRK